MFFTTQYIRDCDYTLWEPILTSKYHGMTWKRVISLIRSELARCLTSFLGRFDKEMREASRSELTVVGGFRCEQTMERCIPLSKWFIAPIHLEYIYIYIKGLYYIWIINHLLSGMHIQVWRVYSNERDDQTQYDTWGGIDLKPPIRYVFLSIIMFVLSKVKVYLRTAAQSFQRHGPKS